MLQVAVYYNKRTQIKISKGKEHGGIQEWQGTASSLSPSVELTLNSSSNCSWKHTPRKLIQVLVSRVFTESHHIDMKFSITNFISILQPPQWSNWCSMAQGSKRIKTDMHYKSCCWCELSSIAQDPTYTKTLLSGRIFQSLRRDLPGQGPVLSLECVGLNLPNLTY